MDGPKLRAWWSFRQGLDGSLRGQTPARVLERSGWARSVGGVGPYLTLFARAGTSRETADRAAASLEVHELPSARGCTYVLPAADFALALKVGQDFGDAQMKVARRVGVTDQEIDQLCDAVVQALGKGPLDPEGIRAATGGASRALGEEGKKKGVTTTLPLAIGRLQSLGEIRRVPVNGRLDQQRYQYTLWRPNPLKTFSLSLEEAHTELARRYFRWTGPATLAEFRWFSGLGVRDSKAAVDPLGLVPLEEGSERLMFGEDHERLQSFEAPPQPYYVLVSGNDAISLLRRDVKGLLDPKDHDRAIAPQKTTQAGSGLTDLPNHAIFDRGRLIGLWEYDTENESLVWYSFGIRDKALTAAVERTQTYIKEQLGDARSFSLDSPRSRAPKIKALRAAQEA